MRFTASLIPCKRLVLKPLMLVQACALFNFQHLLLSNGNCSWSCYMNTAGIRSIKEIGSLLYLLCLSVCLSVPSLNRSQWIYNHSTVCLNGVGAGGGGSKGVKTHANQPPRSKSSLRIHLFIHSLS